MLGCGGGTVWMGGGVVDGVRDWSKRNGGSRAAPSGGVTCGEGGIAKEACGGRDADPGPGPVIGGRDVGVMRL